MAGILVAYATKHGSTRQVAEAVADALRDEGVSVGVRPAAELRDAVVGVDLVVLGAPLYNGRWHPGAHRFLKRHRAELTDVPVAVFGMGPRSGDEESWRRSRAQLDRALARRGWLVPVSVAVFGGVDPPDRRGRRPHRDLRDWVAIRSWAQVLPTVAASRRVPGHGVPTGSAAPSDRAAPSGNAAPSGSGTPSG